MNRNVVPVSELVAFGDKIKSLKERVLNYHGSKKFEDIRRKYKLYLLQGDSLAAEYAKLSFKYGKESLETYRKDLVLIASVMRKLREIKKAGTRKNINGQKLRKAKVV